MMLILFGHTARCCARPGKSFRSVEIPTKHPKEIVMKE
jgi:hypothetical protein